MIEVKYGCRWGGWCSSSVLARLHRHAIFGDVLVFDMCRTRILAQLIGLQCLSGVLFFFFLASLTRLRHGGHASSGKKKKKIIDFDNR